MKYKCILFAILSLKVTLFAVSEAGAVFLLISPSPTMNGLGGDGVGLPSGDTFGAYYNPANGISSFEGISLSHSEMETGWLRNLVPDMVFSYKVTNLSLVPEKKPYQMVLSYHRTFLDLGEQQKTGEHGEVLGTFESYMKADALTLGLRAKIMIYRIPLIFSVGGTRKQALQNLGLTYSSPNRYTKSRNTFYDFGFLITMPLTFRNISPLDNVFSLTFSPSLGYSMSNIGGEVTFLDASQADPSPRFARFGISMISSISYRNRWPLVEWKHSRSASDILIDTEVTRNKHIAYQSGIGDINFIENVWKNEPDSLLTVHKGSEWTFLGVYSIRFGKMVDVSDRINLSTTGRGFRLKGILIALSYFLQEPAFRKLSNYFDVQYNVATYDESASHPLDDTRFESVTLFIKNIDQIIRNLYE